MLCYGTDNRCAAVCGYGGNKKLPITKRRLIIEAIEDTIEYREDDVENYAYEMEEELQILEDRLRDYLKNPKDVVTLEELKKEFLTDGRG
jgi:hypothetical protein